MTVLIETLGWLGSALLIASILQPGILRLRILSLIAAVVLTVYNAFHGTWPMIALNAVIALINVYYLVRYRIRETTDDDPTEASA